MSVPAWRQRQYNRQIERRAEHEALIIKAKSVPCADCGRRYGYWVMDFDHRPGEEKVKAISKLKGLRISTKRLLAEMAKCDVVCANCHRDRTQRRMIEDGTVIGNRAGSEPCGSNPIDVGLGATAQTSTTQPPSICLCWGL